MFDAIDEIGRVVHAEGLDGDYEKSGFLTLATSDHERARVQPTLSELHAHGFSEADYRRLDASACDEHVRVANTRGGIYSPHGAAVQPAKLARGLARAVEKRGVRIYERSAARSIQSGEVTTDHGRLRARVVLRCTEGYTPRLPGLKRQLLPMHPMMIVTEPLPDAAWRAIGATNRVLFGDMHRNLTWAQRTVDGRIAIGRGGSYFYGSRVRDCFAADSPGFARVRQALLEFFPSLDGVEITHRWGGPIALPRDMTPFVRFDPDPDRGLPADTWEAA
jgi:glycine/D-amino acid oxidase-like deaminating enzyme